MKPWDHGAWMRLAVELLVLSIATNAMAPLLSFVLGSVGHEAEFRAAVAGLASFLLLGCSFACAVVGKRAWSVTKRRTLLQRCCIGGFIWFVTFYVFSTISMGGPRAI